MIIYMCKPETTVVRSLMGPLVTVDDGKRSVENRLILCFCRCRCYLIHCALVVAKCEGQTFL